MTVEIFLADYQSIVSGVFRTRFSTTDEEHFFLLLDCGLFVFPVFTLYCFAARVWEWEENGNNPM